MRVGDIGEFALIEAIRDRLARAPPEGEARSSLAPSAVRVGPGDDCAVAAPRPDRELLLKVDEAVEGVHFDLAWLDAASVGRRAMTQALSDIAAMAGEARWALLALGLRTDLPMEDALALVGGAAERAIEYGCLVVGGNVTRAPRVTVAVSVVGEVEAGRALLRSGARPKDGLFVTGEPGLARAGLLAIASGRGAEAGLAAAAARWRDPRPRIEEARFLRDRAGAHAMIDLSDGLAGDLAHLARASGVGAIVDRARLPVGGTLERAAAALGRDPHDLVLEGGEDYELLFAAPPSGVESTAGEFAARFGLPLTRIGEVREGGALEIASGESRREPLRARSYEHFRRNE